MKKLFLVLLLAVVATSWLIYAITFHPADIQNEPVSTRAPAPLLPHGATIKILSYNVQYMAGKNHLFWYDLADGSGPDIRPSAEEITTTLKAVAAVIRDEDPDIVLLQEINDGDIRTDYEDQFARLIALLPDSYRSYSQAFYWKADFVPHPKIMGPAGMKLVTLSKYAISDAIRIQLPVIPANPVSQQFQFKRAILETKLPIEGGGELLVMNTHLDAFAQGTDAMQRQIALIRTRLREYSSREHLWIIGGDFNLLPPGQYAMLEASQQRGYSMDSELGELYERFKAIPPLSRLQNDSTGQWFTTYPNDPAVSRPNKTIDYIFYSNRLTMDTCYVRQGATWSISDHLPVIGVLNLP